MRSNIVKVAEPTYSSPIFDVRDQRSQPLYEPRLPKAKRPRPQSTTKKSRLVLTPKEGWLAMLLLAVAVFCVVYSISSVGWVSHTFILYWSAVAGLCLGLVSQDTSTTTADSAYCRLPQRPLALGLADKCYCLPCLMGIIDSRDRVSHYRPDQNKQ